MFRLFSSVASGARAAGAAYLGTKTLQLIGYGAPQSLSNVVQMNAIGNASLSLVCGTSFELGSLMWLGFSGFRNVTSDNQNPGLTVKNTIAGMSVFTARQLLGAAIGYAMFTIANREQESLGNYLSATTTGSLLFSLGVAVAADLATRAGIAFSGTIINLAAENAAAVFSDVDGGNRKRGPR